MCTSTEIVAVDMKIAYPKIVIQIWDAVFFCHLRLSPPPTCHQPVGAETVQAMIIPLHHPTYTVATGETNPGTENVERGRPPPKAFLNDRCTWVDVR